MLICSTYIAALHISCVLKQSCDFAHFVTFVTKPCSGCEGLCVCPQKLRSMVHEIVGRINGHYGTLTHVPIHHLDRQLSFHELCALYAITDVALVTSLRDGMNLVSYEYVACQTDNAGERWPHLILLQTICLSVHSLHNQTTNVLGFALTLSAACHVASRAMRMWHACESHAGDTYMRMFVSFMAQPCMPFPGVL